MRQKSRRPTAPFYCYKYPKIGVIPVGDRSAADLFVHVFGASGSGEVMIVSVTFIFQVRSLQGLVELETELLQQHERPVAHKLSSFNRKSFLLAQGEILRIQMLALVQR